jgi:DnaJ family protein C protein 27
MYNTKSEMIGYSPRDEINRAYKRLAVLLHPDKSVAPGTEEAFKALVAARASLLQKHR